MSFQQSEKLTLPTTAKQLLETYNYTIKKCSFNIVMINFMLRIYKTESHWRLVKKNISSSGLQSLFWRPPDNILVFHSTYNLTVS